jgi:hypothetical protein
MNPGRVGWVAQLVKIVKLRVTGVGGLVFKSRKGVKNLT